MVYNAQRWLSASAHHNLSMSKEENKENIKNITLASVLAWIVSVILIIYGLSSFGTNAMTGVLVIISGLILFPPLIRRIEKSANTKISGLLRFVLAIILFFWGSSFMMQDRLDEVRENGPRSDTTSQEAKQNEKLELVSFRCYKEHGYFHVSGEVKNISGKSMENVMAVGTSYTETGEMVKSADALIDYNPVLAGQTSPFTVMMTTNPAMSKCKVNFKEFFGGTIPTKVSDSE